MNRNTTIVLVAVFAVLLLYVLLVQLPRDRAAGEATPTAGAATAFLWDLTTDQVVSARVVDHAANRSLAFGKDAAGVWTMTEPDAQPADQAAALTAAGKFVALLVNSTITSTTELSQFGVLSPTYTLEVTAADGQVLSAAVGDKTPTGTGYYLLRQGESNVVVVSNFYVDEVVKLLDAPPVPSTPTAQATAAVTVTGEATAAATSGSPVPSAAATQAPSRTPAPATATP